MIREEVGDREFRVDDAGFWQVHAAAPLTLTRAVQDAIDDALFDPKAANLDLYGGVGLLAAAVGDKFGPTTRITSVESDARATEHAYENLADWLGAQAVTARVEHWVRALPDASALEKARLAAATVVLDPPRSGAGREVLEALAAVATRAARLRGVRSGRLRPRRRHPRRARLSARRAARLRPLPEHAPRRGGRRLRARMTSRHGIPGAAGRPRYDEPRRMPADDRESG